MTGFREQGHGTPLVLLHGISSGAASWHKQMALSGYRVLAWDMPGYGESPMLPVEQANAGDYADALARLLDHAGVERAVVVGHSLGALVASAFAAKYPRRVRYLVLADVAQGYGPGGAGTAGKSLAESPAADCVRRRTAGAKPGGEAVASLCGGGRCRHRCRRNAQAAS